MLHNAINLGKGAALKHGINFALSAYPNLALILTLDCDGQHTIEDIKKLRNAFLDSNATLAIGSREFNSKALGANKIPFRSSFGNKLTASIFRLMFGIRLRDTQSGLRAFSAEFARMILHIPYNGYEFEMQMLVTACNNAIKILQVPISTIYINNNASSHFNPILDSLSIYFVLFRHIANSLLTAIIDYIVFVIIFSLHASLLSAMVAGRVVAGSFNFIIGKRFVFKSKENLAFELFSYAFLTIILMLFSMWGIKLIVHYSNLSEIIVKPMCEAMIFLVSFLAQRFIIFKPRGLVESIGGGR